MNITERQELELLVEIKYFPVDLNYLVWLDRIPDEVIITVQRMLQSDETNYRIHSTQKRNWIFYYMTVPHINRYESTTSIIREELIEYEYKRTR